MRTGSPSGRERWRRWGKSGPGTMSIKPVDPDLRIVQHREAGIDHLAQIVRRHVGRHADRDPARAVDQQVGDSRRQDFRLVYALVVVGAEIDRPRARCRPASRAPRGSGGPRCSASPPGGIAVHRAEIALPVDQRQAHREVLRHADHGVVDRLVAMRVVLAHYVAHDARGLAVGAGSTRSPPRASHTGCGGAPA